MAMKKDRRYVALQLLGKPVFGRDYIHPIGTEPELFCEVDYLEWTRAGRLRGASFHGLVGVGVTTV